IASLLLTPRPAQAGERVRTVPLVRRPPMSTGYPVTPAPPAAPAGLAPAPAVVPDEEIRVYGHSNLFYWWPVWACGFLLAALTYVDGHVMAIVPKGTQVEAGQVLVTPPGQSIPQPQPGARPGEDEPRLRV